MSRFETQFDQFLLNKETHFEKFQCYFCRKKVQVKMYMTTAFFHQSLLHESEV